MIIKIVEVSKTKTYMKIIIAVVAVVKIVAVIMIIWLAKRSIKRRRKKKTNDAKPSE